jgi:hypothetical protein
VDELRKLAEAATPGPWRYYANPPRAMTTTGSVWAETGDFVSPVVYKPTTADARYLEAASPDVILGLLDRIAELEKPGEVSVGMVYAYEAGLAELDEERLALAVRTVTTEYRLDIIENEDDGDMASVMFPHEFARKIAAEYARSSSKVETT